MWELFKASKSHFIDSYKLDLLLKKKWQIKGPYLHQYDYLRKVFNFNFRSVIRFLMEPNLTFQIRMSPLRPFLSRQAFVGAAHPQRPPSRQARVPILRRPRHSPRKIVSRTF